VEKHDPRVQDTIYFTRLKAGEEMAFDYFFSRYYAGLCVFAKKFLKDAGQAEETVQDVFLKLWRNRNTLDITFSVRAYLFTSVKNQCLDALKHTKLGRDCLEKLADSIPGPRNETWDTYVESELFEFLDKAVEKLPAECRKIFRESRFDFIPNREIAQKEGLSVKTVENQLTKALKMIRNELRDYLEM
jgi:RNA polymerase sigma-70 factor (ECF subfamily)